VATFSDLPDICRAHILSFLDNKSFGAAQCTAKCFHVSSVSEILIRKIKDYSLCFCFQDIEPNSRGPYAHASHRGWIDFAKYLQKNEIPFSVATYDYIAIAYRCKQYPIIEWFIENGYKPSFCAFNLAIADGNIPFYERLLQLFPETENRDEFTLDRAIESGNVSTVQYLLDHGFSIPMDVNSIIASCKSGNVEMMEFVESYWGMTCRQAIDRHMEDENERIEQSDMPNKKKKKALKFLAQRNPYFTIPWTTVIHKRPCEREKWDRIPILDKLHEQGFFDDERNRDRIIMDIFNEDTVDVLSWFKEKGYLPTEIRYPDTIHLQDISQASNSKEQLLFHWIVDNNITFKVYDQVVSPFEALKIIEARSGRN